MEKRINKLIFTAFITLLLLSSSFSPTSILFGVETAQAAGTDRISGETRFDTAVSISKIGWKSAENVVLANGLNFPDALSGAPLSYALDAPILLVRKDKIPVATTEEITRLKPQNIYILGGEGAISEDVVTQLKESDFNVIRISGETRYETATGIGNELRKSNSQDTAFVVYGRNYPDALSVGGLASEKGWPILFTGSSTLNNETKKSLEAWGIKKVFIIGGTVAINDTVSKEIANMNINVERLAGEDRVKTSLTIAERFYPKAEGAVISTGYNFPDALAGGPLAAKLQNPILLVKPNKTSQSTMAYITASGAKNAKILGGASAVNENIVYEISTLEKQWTKTFDSFSDPKFYIQNIFMDRLKDVAYNGEVYVAVGDRGIVQISYNGNEWQDVFLEEYPGNGYLNRVIWNGKMFITSGLSGGYLVSIDGVNWDLKKFDKDYTFSNFVYTGGKHFFLVNGEFNPSKNIAWMGGGFPLVGNDGLVWEKGQFKGSDPMRHLMAVKSNGEKFLGAANGGDIAESKDGMNWNIIGNIRDSIKYSFDINEFLWNDQDFVILGNGSYLAGDMHKSSSDVLVSPDGVEWKSVFNIKHVELKDIAWNGNEYAMIVQHVNYETSGKRLIAKSVIYTSSNLIEWTPEYEVKNPYPDRWEDSQGRERYLESISWNGKSFIAVGTEIVEWK